MCSAESESGENDCEIQAEIEGNENRVAVNGKLLIDVLMMLKDQKIFLGVNGPEQAIILMSLDNDKYVNLIMPMAISW
mgnify:CR=1 FL=1